LNELLVNSTKVDSLNGLVMFLVPKNPRNAVTPEIGVGWLPEGSGYAITYPNSSSGPFQNCGLFVNPDVGVPTAKLPTCSVPSIDGLGVGLNANALVVDIFVFFKAIPTFLGVGFYCLIYYSYR
jgi:hypothetical protein